MAQYESKTMISPKFIGIGAQRAATTWLHSCLNAHPEIFVPPCKEVHFFDKNYEKGINWYEEHFQNASSEMLCGEITPNYLDVTVVAERIASHYPNTKLFVVLREPVSRAQSSFDLYAGNVRYAESFHGKSFSDVCKEGHWIVEQGLYAKHLSRFRQHFPSTSIHVILYEDILENPLAVLHDLCEYVGCSPDLIELPNANNTNSIIFPKTQQLLRKLHLDSVITLAKRGPWANSIRKIAATNKKQSREKSISHQTFAHLFRDDVLKLQDMIGRDLSNWL